jgi:hypothetical protein
VTGGGQPIDPRVKAFLAFVLFVLSKEGEELAKLNGGRRVAEGVSHRGCKRSWLGV